jgi:hypothetical protein
LADPSHVAVAEDPKAALDESMVNAITLGLLHGQELHDSLANSKANLIH